MDVIEQVAMFRLKIRETELQPHQKEIMQIRLNRKRMLVQQDKQNAENQINLLQQQQSRIIHELRSKIQAEADNIRKFGITVAELNIFHNDQRLQAFCRTNDFLPQKRAKSAQSYVIPQNSSQDLAQSIKQLENQFHSTIAPENSSKQYVRNYMDSMLLSSPEKTGKQRNIASPTQLLQNQLDIIEKHERVKNLTRSQTERFERSLREHNKTVEKVLEKQSSQHQEYCEKQHQKTFVVKGNLQQLVAEQLKQSQKVYTKLQKEEVNVERSKSGLKEKINRQAQENDKQIQEILANREYIDQLEHSQKQEYLNRKQLLIKQNYQIPQQTTIFLQNQLNRCKSVSTAFSIQQESQNNIKQSQFLENQKQIENKVIKAQKQKQEQIQSQSMKKNQRAQSACAYQSNYQQKLNQRQNLYLEPERVPQHVKLTPQQRKIKQLQQFQQQVIENEKQSEESTKQTQEQRWQLLKQKVQKTRELQQREQDMKQYLSQQQNVKTENLIKQRKTAANTNQQIATLLSSIHSDAAKKQIIQQHLSQTQKITPKTIGDSLLDLSQ